MICTSRGRALSMTNDSVGGDWASSTVPAGHNCKPARRSHGISTKAIFPSDPNIVCRMQALTMDTICKSAMGADFSIQKHGPSHPLVVAAGALFDMPSSMLMTVIGEH